MRLKHIAPSVTAFAGDLVMRATMAVLLLSLIASPAKAIVVRHDAEPSAYLASPSDYPAVFGLLRTRRGFLDCPATLVAPHWAITAGHCAEAPRISQAMQGGGGYRVDIAGSSNTVDRVVAHPSGEDVALLHLTSAIVNVTPVGLYMHSDEVGQIIEMVGWGDTGDGATGPTTPDGQFRHAENRVDQAESAMLSWTFSDPRAPGTDAVSLEGISGPGDSGGPAFIRATSGLLLAGISSGQDPMGHARGTYGVREYFVRVSAIRNWIEQAISAAE